MSIKMPKSALIIRNISQLSLDEMRLLIHIFCLNQIEAKRGEPVAITQFRQAIEEDDIHGAIQSLEYFYVREFLYDKIKREKGCHVIFHKDIKKEEVTQFEKHYILTKLAEIESNTHMDLLYIGGGHGGYVDFGPLKFLSGLEGSDISDLLEKLRDKSITFGGGILHSCSSAMFVDLFRPLLAEKGGFLSYCAEIGSSSNWEMTMKWIVDPSSNHPFFSPDALARPWELGDLGTTTSVISTKYTNQLMDLDNSDRGFPDYVAKEEVGEVHREFVLDHLIEGNKEIKTIMETDTTKFNDVVAMKKFNVLLDSAMAPHESDEASPDWTVSL